METMKKINDERKQLFENSKIMNDKLDELLEKTLDLLRQLDSQK
tara:strand:- start:356 stop:487 length:132 start_codon:yes stop_codon:yes gene_type:complete